ncbi:hypothetical protein RB195_023245 [Necator americanus]|uniref:Uncharacterized protein n=1 Tax=Necator americanus TaxID=51031 RepID=A0ABR1EID5_NECAM
MLPKQEPRSTSSTENRHGRSEKRRMQNEFLPCVHSCNSPDQEEALQCGLLHKVHPERCKGNAPGSNAAKKFAFASVETRPTYNSVCVARSTDDFNQEKRLRRKLRRQLQQDRDNKWTSKAMEFEVCGRTRARGKPMLY